MNENINKGRSLDFDSAESYTDSPLPLYITPDIQLQYKCNFLWFYGEWAKKYRNTDFSGLTEAELRDIQSEAKSLKDIYELTQVREKTGPYLLELGKDDAEIAEEVTKIDVDIQTKFVEFHRECNFQTTDLAPTLPHLTNERDISRILHDTRNTLGTVTNYLELIVPAKGGIRQAILDSSHEHIAEVFGEMFVNTKKAYKAIEEGDLPPEMSSVPVVKIDTEINKLLGDYIRRAPQQPRESRRYFKFLKQFGLTEVKIDLNDFKELLRNHRQNLKRIYDKRDGAFLDLADNPRTLKVWYGFLRESDMLLYEAQEPEKRKKLSKKVSRTVPIDGKYYQVIVFDDEALGFPDKLLKAGGFIYKESTQGGEGIGMFESQERHKRWGAKMLLENYQYDPKEPGFTGARLIVAIPMFEPEANF